MPSRRVTLERLGLSAPLLALVTGRVAHPALAQEYRFFPDDHSQPSLTPPVGLIPLWEDAQGPPHFFTTIFAKQAPAGLEFWSVIFDEDRESDGGDRLAGSEQGLLFWLFHELHQRELGSDQELGWDLPALADQLGFLYWRNLVSYCRACSAGLDDEDRIWDLVRAFPASLPEDRTGSPERRLELAEGYYRLHKYAVALDDLHVAWADLPEPPAEHPLAVEILVAIADCEFRLRHWQACHDSMQLALRCGLSVDDVLARLRLGQSLYELGKHQEAANWLVPLYLLHGRQPFASDDPKYLELFRSQLQPPDGGWPEGW